MNQFLNNQPANIDYIDLGALSFFNRFASFFSFAVFCGAFLFSLLVSFVFDIYTVVYCDK
jgi:hypothetical protein